MWTERVLTCGPRKDPLDHSDIFAKAGPQKAAVASAAKPVHHKDGRRPSQFLAHAEPVAQVVPKVVSKEGAHGEGVMHHLAPLVLGGGSRLGLDACA